MLILIARGIWVFCSTREHLLSTLLRLEYIVLGIFFFFFIGFIAIISYYALFYLVITACEGALGLSLLVIIRRTHGGDFFKIFNLN